ncbi:MAG: DUF4861 domain-containing protein [Cyclobacteriaceae bacterium]|nr:DUF4861 domain-containing protein [Cyclobacteriaceae bacterium]UYN85777.1 MAG: DUF4861 domain-containing protein [Cyclobacteriaceae bacterium]
MKTSLIISLLLLGMACEVTSQKKEFSESFTVKVSNPAAFDRADVLALVPENQLPKSFNEKAFAVFADKTEIPSQYNTKDKLNSGIAVVLDKLNANQSIVLTVRYSKTGEVNRVYPKRTQAELSPKFGGEWKNREYIGGDFKNVTHLRVPPQHKDHSWYIRYEGPGWESDKVGYRFYLDQRNAVDVFGKTVKEPALHKAGLDGFDSYHSMQEWGMDVLKVAKSLGVGSIGYFDGKAAHRVEITDSVECSITENGVVYSSILTNYYGWKAGANKTNLSSQLSIHAGSRLTETSLSMSDAWDNISSGLIKDPKGKLFTHKGSTDQYGYLATYGKQSLNDDNLGIAVLFNASDFIGFTEDDFSHIVKMKPSNGKLTYYFAAAWEGEPDGIKTEEAFLKYLEQEAKKLASPVRVEVVKK